MLDRFKGRALSLRLRQPVNELWDRRLGVRTFGYSPAIGRHGEPGWASHYEPFGYADLFRALKAAGVGPGSRYTDLGCGLGRTLFAAAHLGAESVTGVELVPALAEGAEANRRRSRHRGRAIRIVAGDAADHALGDASHIYMFHSFGPDVIRRVFDRARADRRAAGITSPLRLIYANPVEDRTIEGLGWLRPIARLPARRAILSNADSYAVTIWESRE